MNSTICEFQKVILKEINDYPDGNLSVAELEVGCGTGGNLKYLFDEFLSQ